MTTFGKNENERKSLLILSRDKQETGNQIEKQARDCFLQSVLGENWNCHVFVILQRR